jgi:hypothetical protein
MRLEPNRSKQNRSDEVPQTQNFDLNINLPKSDTPRTPEAHSLKLQHISQHFATQTPQSTPARSSRTRSPLSTEESNGAVPSVEEQLKNLLIGGSMSREDLRAHLGMLSAAICPPFPPVPEFSGQQTGEVDNSRTRMAAGAAGLDPGSPNAASITRAGSQFPHFLP